MNFGTIEYNNIKGFSGRYDMQPVTVVSGANGTGKSAFLEAVRLAATGKPEIGTRSAPKLVSGETAGAVLDDRFRWQCESSSQKHVGDNLQGGMPITVEEFWDLTASERLGLLGNSSVLEDTMEQLDHNREMIKKLKKRMDIPPPAQPERYEGPPLGELERDIAAAEKTIQENNIIVEALGVHAESASRAKQQLDEINKKRASLTETSKITTKSLKSLQAERDAVLSKIESYRTSAAEIPRLLRGAENLENFAEEVTDALLWLRENGALDDRFRWQCEILSRLKGPIPGFPGQQELLVATGNDPEQWLLHINGEIDQLEKILLENRNEQLALAVKEKSCQRILDNHPGEPLSAEALEALVRDLAAMRRQEEHARSWLSHESRLKEFKSQRDLNWCMLQDHEASLTTLGNRRIHCVSDLKGGVQNDANGILQVLGEKPLSLSVGGSARRPTLEIEVGGVALESLATSEKLLYGICLLLAIQQASNAECPILIAHCAEMDFEKFTKLVRGLRAAKGNVLLEHWTIPEDGSVIVMEEKWCSRMNS